MQTWVHAPAGRRWLHNKGNGTVHCTHCTLWLLQQLPAHAAAATQRGGASRAAGTGRTISPTWLTGRKRLGATGTVCTKNSS